MQSKEGNSQKRYGLILEAFLVGGCAGIISVLYRQLLTWTEDLVMWLSQLIHAHLYLLIPISLLFFVIGVLIIRLLRYEPMISGSGIPQIEGEVHGDFQENWRRVLPCKMIAGTLASLAGLSLGREGPSIQLGGMCGKGVAQLLHKEQDQEQLIICGAGAGLAAAFNAPLAGVLFCVEEVTKDLRTSTLLSLLAAAMTGDFLSRMVFGFAPSFSFWIDRSLPLAAYGWIIGLGIVCGMAGAFYNYATLHIQDLFAKLHCLRNRRSVFVALFASLLFLLFLPQVLCGGHVMVSLLESEQLLQTLLLLLLMKFFFSLISFGSGAAGGIFFPMLVLGSYLGAIYGNAVFLISDLDPSFLNNFIILGMAALFSAIVRAPLTGVVLIMEMSGGMPQLLSLCFVSFVAYFTAQFCRSQPIYDSLLERMKRA